MKLTQKLSHRAIAITAILMAVTTFALHGWNRISHHMVGLLTPEERWIARLIFIITLFAGYGAPFVVSLLVREEDHDREWPIHEGIMVGAGFLIALVVWWVPVLIPIPWGGTDVIATFVWYTAVFFAYSFTLKKAITACRARNWAKALTNFGLIFVTGFIIFIAGGMVVYFE